MVWQFNSNSYTNQGLKDVFKGKRIHNLILLILVLIFIPLINDQKIHFETFYE